MTYLVGGLGTKVPPQSGRQHEMVWEPNDGLCECLATGEHAAVSMALMILFHSPSQGARNEDNDWSYMVVL